MKTASSLFNPQEKQSVEAAIAAAENMTAGEIVPVVATVSGRYDRAEDVFGILVGIVALTTVWVLFQEPAWTTGSATQDQVLGLPAVVGILIGGFLLGAMLASFFPALRLPFIARAEMIEEVERRAIETFQQQRVRATAGGTGVLIYVSLYEHIVKVICDDAAAAILPTAALEEICALVVDGLKQGKPADGIQQAITRTGELLAQHLPRTADNTNELQNHLILID